MADKISYSTHLLQVAVRNYLQGDPQVTPIDPYLRGEAPAPFRADAGMPLVSSQTVTATINAGVSALHQEVLKGIDGTTPNSTAVIPDEDPTVALMLAESHRVLRERLGI